MAWDAAQVTRWERHLKAMVKDAGQDDPEALAELFRMAEWLRGEGVQEAARQQHENGYSLREIARPLPVSAQAVHKWMRYGPVTGLGAGHKGEDGAHAQAPQVKQPAEGRT